MQQIQKYDVSSYNDYSEQIYPIKVNKVEYVNFISEKYSNGCIQISCQTIDGYYCTGLLKCYVSKKGKYTIWGKHRIYEGYSGAIKLIGIPYSMEDIIKTFTDIE